MTEPHAASAAASDAHSYDIEAAEEAFILQAQSQIESLMKLRNVRPRELARRMNVSEGRISHLLSDNGGKNITLKTVAKIFHCLGETARLGAGSEWDRLKDAREAEAEAVEAGTWTIRGGLTVSSAARSAAPAGTDPKEVPSSKHSIGRWASVELDVPTKPTTSRAK